MRGWLSKASGLAWCAAEFHPIAEMFGWVDAYDLLDDYARLAGQREPGDATWRYYQLVARAKGDPDRLSFTETDELCDIEEAAAQRRDFHLANRIQRFLDGPRSPESRGSKPSSKAGHFDDDDEPADLVSQLLAAVLEDTPPDLVQRLVKKHGRSQAVTALVDRIRATPLGGMPEPVLRRLANAMVEIVTGTNSGPMHD
jgi:hypothetical protein